MYLTVEKSCGNDRTTWTPLKAQLYQLSLLPVAKGNVCVKPWDGKASSPMKRARKRKADEISPSAVAAVNPRRSTEEEEPPAKKAKIAALVRRGGSVSAVLVRLLLTSFRSPLAPMLG